MTRSRRAAPRPSRTVDAGRIHNEGSCCSERVAAAARGEAQPQAHPGGGAGSPLLLLTKSSACPLCLLPSSAHRRCPLPSPIHLPLVPLPPPLAEGARRCSRRPRCPPGRQGRGRRPPSSSPLAARRGRREMEEAAVLFALGAWAERGCPAVHAVHEQQPNPTRGQRLAADHPWCVRTRRMTLIWR